MDYTIIFFYTFFGWAVLKVLLFLSNFTKSMNTYTRAILHILEILSVLKNNKISSTCYLVTYKMVFKNRTRYKPLNVTYNIIILCDIAFSFMDLMSFNILLLLLNFLYKPVEQ